MPCDKNTSASGLLLTLLSQCCLLTVSHAALGNTAGVFPPGVQAGHRSLQYRATLDPDTGALGTRLHYQESLNGDVMLRGILHASEDPGGHSRVDFAQGELFWDLSDDADQLRHGLRFDARVRGRGEPSSVSANYSLQYHLNTQWQARLAILNTRSFGGSAPDDIDLQVRSQLSYQTSPTISLNLEYYSQLGALDDLSPWKTQKHQIGPSVNWRLPSKWIVHGGLLSSMNDRSPQTLFRIWLTKTF